MLSMTAHLLHAVSGGRYSFVPKKLLNFAMSQQCAALESAGVSIRVHNGAFEGRLDIESLVDSLAPDDTLVLPLMDAVGCGETLLAAKSIHARTGVRLVATSFLATFCSEEIRASFPEVHILAGEVDDALPALVQNGVNTPFHRASPVAPARWIDPGAAARWGRFAALETSRGCSHFCSFCSANFMADPRGRPGWRALPAASLRRWIEGQSSGGATFVELVDADFLGTTEAGLGRARALAEGGPIGPNIMAATRADTVVSHRQLIDDLRGIGFLKWQVGVESADQATLDRYHKQLRPATSLAAVRALRDLGAELRLEFIMFEPWSTLDTLRANLALLAELSSLGVLIQRALFNRLRVGRWNKRGFGTLQRDGRLVRHIFPLYDYVDYDPTVGAVFRTIQAAMGPIANQATTRYLIIERLADVGVIPSDVSHRHLARLDEVLWSLVDTVVKDAPDLHEPARYAESLEAPLAAWMRTTESFTGPEIVCLGFPMPSNGSIRWA